MRLSLWSWDLIVKSTPKPRKRLNPTSQCSMWSIRTAWLFRRPVVCSSATQKVVSRFGMYHWDMGSWLQRTTSRFSQKSSKETRSMRLACTPSTPINSLCTRETTVSGWSSMRVRGAHVFANDSLGLYAKDFRLGLMCHQMDSIWSQGRRMVCLESGMLHWSNSSALAPMSATSWIWSQTWDGTQDTICSLYLASVSTSLSLYTFTSDHRRSLTELCSQVAASRSAQKGHRNSRQLKMETNQKEIRVFTDEIGSYTDSLNINLKIK